MKCKRFQICFWIITGFALNKMLLNTNPRMHLHSCSVLGFVSHFNLGGSGDGSVRVSGCGIISVQLAICWAHHLHKYKKTPDCSHKHTHRATVCMVEMNADIKICNLDSLYLSGLADKESSSACDLECSLKEQVCIFSYLSWNKSHSQVKFPIYTGLTSS